MPESCPECNCEITRDTEKCPFCGANVRAIRAESQAVMLESAIDGWRAENERLRCAIEDAYREGWEAREGHAEECLGEAIMDAAWRVSEAADAAKENER